MMIDFDMPVFLIRDWFWQIGADESRYWSSAAGTYVAEAQEGRITMVPSLEDLQAALAQLGLSAPSE
ncbi:hypothetical protein [Hyphomicrobium sp. DY-1]|uniref:hypothetical protein n=1 Tax=Hyphomicrobium sp. DY-1 TaxID=3075650 RepID=UPI0039C2AF53